MSIAYYVYMGYDADDYRNTDFRAHPGKYKIGRGEQGVLMAEPYKSEILPNWKFKTEADARKSAATIYDQFLTYGKQNDFVGMDMARKFLQMGFTRARRYANHSSGKKYDTDGTVLPQDSDCRDSEKAKAAQVFYDAYSKAANDARYLELKREHLLKQHGD